MLENLWQRSKQKQCNLKMSNVLNIDILEILKQYTDVYQLKSDIKHSFEKDIWLIIQSV